MDLQRLLARLMIVLLTGLLASGCVTVIIEPSSTDTPDLIDVVRDAELLAGGAGAEQVLVVFDLDNTLLAMEQGLGSDQWYEWQKEQFSQEPCDARVVADRLAVQGALYFASAMRPTQPVTPSTVIRSAEA